MGGEVLLAFFAGVVVMAIYMYLRMRSLARRLIQTEDQLRTLRRIRRVDHSGHEHD